MLAPGLQMAFSAGRPWISPIKSQSRLCHLLLPLSWWKSTASFNQCMEKYMVSATRRAIEAYISHGDFTPSSLSSFKKKKSVGKEAGRMVSPKADDSFQRELTRPFLNGWVDRTLANAALHSFLQAHVLSFSPYDRALSEPQGGLRALGE